MCMYGLVNYVNIINNMHVHSQARTYSFKHVHVHSLKCLYILTYIYLN